MPDAWVVVAASFPVSSLPPHAAATMPRAATTAITFKIRFIVPPLRSPFPKASAGEHVGLFNDREGGIALPRRLRHERTGTGGDAPLRSWSSLPGGQPASTVGPRPEGVNRSGRGRALLQGSFVVGAR